MPNQKQSDLQKIANQVARCTRCPLYQGTNRSVPGEGNPDAAMMFIGEGPGYYEDQRGIPFCGAAGNLLDKLLALIKVERDEVWIGNVVKHRPPGNRDPMPEEIEACRSFLDKQIEIISPKIIVTLGRFSMRKFLPGEFISRCHGQARWVNFKQKRYLVMPMYHPAAALRNAKIMADIREDFQKIPKYLESQPVETEAVAEAEAPEKEDQQLSLIN